MALQGELRQQQGVKCFNFRKGSELVEASEAFWKGTLRHQKMEGQRKSQIKGLIRVLSISLTSLLLVATCDQTGIVRAISKLGISPQMFHLVYPTVVPAASSVLPSG
ncbi:hypothetical protein ACTXT7_006584 [Hymenolepis weldensis]